jgi:solute:Na+ symporter, SSS family
VKGENHWIPLTVMAVYVVLLYVVTWWSRRLSRKDGMVGYLLAGRNLPFWIAAAMLTGLAVGGASTIGVAENAYVNGLGAGLYNAAWGVAAIVAGLFVVRRIRDMKLTTIPEMFERYYSVGGRVLGVVGQLVIQVVITSLQYVAGGAILHSLLPGVFSPAQGMLVTAVVFVGITLVGGFWAAGLTNIINVVLIYVGVVLGAVMILNKPEVGGLSGVAEMLPAGHAGFSLGGLPGAMILAWFVVMAVTALGTQSVLQVGFASRDGRAARRGFLLGGMIILPVGFISALIGLAAVGLHPGIEAKDALPMAVLDLHPLVAGMILAGLWAADVSTACALLLGSATLVVDDVIKRFFAPGLTARGEWLVSRGTVLAISVATFVLAAAVETGILTTLLAGLALNAGYALMVLVTLFCPSLCRRGSAFWVLVATFAAFGAWYVTPESWHLPHPVYHTLIAAVAVFFLVAVIDRRRIDMTELNQNQYQTD